MSRFILYVGIAFVTAFVGVSWGVRGFPMWSHRPVTQLQPTITSTFGDTRETEEDRNRKGAINLAEKIANPALDKLRLDTLQAANAYSLSPCDKTIKANLVAALTAYTQAWQRTLNCSGPRMFCKDADMLRATSTFSTSLDKRVKEALDSAFEQKGIVKADFPPSVQFDLLQFAGPNFWSGESPVCARLAATGRPPN